MASDDGSMTAQRSGNVLNSRIPFRSTTMSPPYTPLQPATLQHDANARPVSTRYGDVYQPAQDTPLRQAREVFLAGNHLPQRWQGSPRFTVLETGFGLGMNFLALWHAWQDDPQRCARLHVVSLEAHPLAHDDLARVHAALPVDIAPLATQLRNQWPERLPGLHRLEFTDGAVTLTLGFGLAHELAPKLSAKVDAFFLDGFAPACNPEMWRPDLLAALARLAAPDATLATWTSAGVVRRTLQDVGFAVTRVAGAHGKRHVTRAVYQGHGPSAVATLPIPSQARHALVVGAGPAGAGIAHALGLRGWQVDVFDPRFGPPLAHGPVGRHHGHVAAALTPVIDRDDPFRARLSRAGSLRAQARWQHLPDNAAPWRCGTVQPARDAAHAKRLQQTLAALAFPADWVRWVGRDDARRITGLPVMGDGIPGGVYLRDGLLVRPDALLTALLGTTGITLHARRVAALRPAAVGWQALDDHGRVLSEAAIAVIANAAGAPQLLPADSLALLPRLQSLHALAGEISLLPASVLAGGPRCIVGGAGYLLPAVNGWCVAGSTYVHGASTAQTSAAGRCVNIDKAANLSGLSIDAHTDADIDTASGWAGWRAVLPGRLPAIGPVPNAPGLWLATGYASRGLTWSALAGDLIGATLEGEPLPLEQDLLAAITPR